MVQILFFLRFRAQLRRTRPEITARLENVFSGAAAVAGGRAVNGRRILEASFDGSRIGFWLDMLIFFETLHKSLERYRLELSGYALVLGRDIPEENAERLCMDLSSGEAARYTGIWCAGELLANMTPYGVFGKPVNGYGELRAFNSTADENSAAQFPFRERIGQILAQGDGRNTLLMGPEFTGKRDGVYHYCDGLMGDVPPLVFRFGTGGGGPACFADALSPAVRAFIGSSTKKEGAGQEIPETLDSLQSLLFRERLRRELPASVIKWARRFLNLLLPAYMDAVSGRLSQAVLIVEDILDIEEQTGKLFRQALGSSIKDTSKDTDKLLIIGICNTDEAATPEGVKSWGGVFPRILKIATEDAISIYKLKIEMPGDLWETAYAAALLGRYFPAWLFPRLFEEEGLNRGIIDKAREIFVLSGTADNAGDIRLRIPNFMARAEKNLGARKDLIRHITGNRLLAWVSAGRLSPCFDLLKALAGLGCRVEDALALKAVRGDVFNHTFAAIETSLGSSPKGKNFSSYTGAENMPALVWIYNTLKVLVHGLPGEIRKAFSVPPPAAPAEGAFYPGCEAQIKANLTSRYLGVRDAAAAAETVKEAMLLNQGVRDGAIPSYRLFSLVNLARRHLDDAVEYIAFAVDQAEKTGEHGELVKACYFAGGIHFLYGNLQEAEQFALKAEKTAAGIGHLDWAARARFFRGRLKFEAGGYAEALEIFNDLMADTGEAVEGKVQTLEAWIFRAGFFLNLRLPLRLPNSTGREKQTAKSTPGGNTAGICADRRLFEIEAAFLEGRYGEAVALAGKFQTAALPKDGDYFFTEQPDWRSGFAQAEDMIIPGSAYRERLALIYQALAQCSLCSAGEAPAAFVDEMQRFTREGILADGDPSDAFYYYALYCMLKNTGAVQLDMGTAVSMAFKRLQRRASRIGDSQIRRAYLSENYWNAALSLAAKEYKLI
jgi:tetratricopeptide (TPR) repeat protein